ncbi:MAG: helix-turn-helix transcriptional regulator [Arenimonas sp.]
METAAPLSAAAGAGWTFLSNHTHVLVCLAGDDGSPTVRDIAIRVGITERAVMRILSELEAAGVIAREREGRRNRYRIDGRFKLRHPLEDACEIGELLALVKSRTAGREA